MFTFKLLNIYIIYWGSIIAGLPRVRMGRSERDTGLQRDSSASLPRLTT